MIVSLSEVSRAVSHALRHEPWLYELELDDEGWVSVDQLVDGVHRLGPRWKDIDRSTIERMVTGAAKQRHELRGHRIRARYGHSVPGRISLESAQPPRTLYHGTSPDSLGQILGDGLKPMARQYVHLSPDHDTAVQVGRRKAQPSAVLRVDAERAWAEGTIFYRGNRLVWLADLVRPTYLQVAEDALEADGGRSS